MTQLNSSCEIYFCFEHVTPVFSRNFYKLTFWMNQQSITRSGVLRALLVDKGQVSFEPQSLPQAYTDRAKVVATVPTMFK